MPSTPYAVLTAVEAPVPAFKHELLTLSRRLERLALADPPPYVGAALQDCRYLTPRTRQVYADLAAAGSRATLYARGLQSWLAPGVTGVPLDDDDPLVDEWVVVLPGEDPVVFAATDLRIPDCADEDRCFSYGVSRDPAVVRQCGELLGLGAAVSGT